MADSGPTRRCLAPGPGPGSPPPADPFASGRHWLDSNASVQFGIGTSLPVVLLKVPSDGPCSESAEIFYVDPMSRASGARDSSDQPYLYRTTRLKAAMPLSSDGTGLALQWKLDVMISISDSLTMSLTSAMRRICSRFR